MTQTAEPVRVLVDLKPALDGYAGIPQETRLFFAHLLVDGQFSVDGLLQHGSGQLESVEIGANPSGRNAEHIVAQARTVVSFFAGAGQGFKGVTGHIKRNYWWHSLLAWKALRGEPLVLGHLDGNLFPDFIWSRLFARSVGPRFKARLTAGGYRVLGPSRKAMQVAGLRPFSFFNKPHFARVDTRGYGVFVAQTPFPGRVSAGTRLIVRYHDAVPVLLPHTVNEKAFHLASHFVALRQNVADGAWFACVSDATRQDLLTLYPQVRDRAVVIPNMVSEDYFQDDCALSLAHQIIRRRQSATGGAACDLSNCGYLLVVSTIEPRKNHLALLAAWEQLRQRGHSTVKLVVVGSAGWDSEAIFEQFRYWIERGELLHLSNVPAYELRVLYRHAGVTVCPSIAEGFDYSGVEAMRCGCPVMASDIAVHREIFQDAAVYFDPYDLQSAVDTLCGLLSEAGAERRLTLQRAGARVSKSYAAQAVLPLWHDLLNPPSL
jgi:glycosyltransferase involved in cell wall biosynthesis